MLPIQHHDGSSSRGSNASRRHRRSAATIEPARRGTGSSRSSEFGVANRPAYDIGSSIQRSRALTPAADTLPVPPRQLSPPRQPAPPAIHASVSVDRVRAVPSRAAAGASLRWSQSRGSVDPPPSVRVEPAPNQHHSGARETTIKVDAFPFFFSGRGRAAAEAAPAPSRLYPTSSPPAPPLATAPSPRRQPTLLNVAGATTELPLVPPPQGVSSFRATPAAADAAVSAASAAAATAAAAVSLRAYFQSLTEPERDQLRSSYMRKIAVLARNFPAWKIAMPGEDVSLEHMHRTYDTYVRQATMQNNSMFMRIGLVALFVAIEVGAAHAGIPLTGYAKRQMNKLQKYDMLLAELGEKYSATGEGGTEWPAEVRICFLAVFQAAIFLAAAWFSRKLGLNEDKVYDMLDRAVETYTAPSAAEDDSPPAVDAQGLPMAPGTEDEIREIDAISGDVAAAIEAAGPPRAARAAPAVDLGGLVGNLLGGGNLDVAGLVGAATKLLAGGGGAASPLTAALGALAAGGAARPAPTSPRSGARTSGGTSPRAPPRQAPVFDE